MPALTLTLDDQITDGLIEIDKALGKLSQTSMITAKSAERFADVQARQTVIIQQQKRDYSELQAVSVRVFGDIAVAGVKAFDSITVASIKTTAAMNELVVREGASLVRWAIGGTVALGGMATYLVATARAHRDNAAAMEESNVGSERFGRNLIANRGYLAAGGAALADQAVGYGLLGKAAEIAGKAAINAATGAGPYVLGATIGWKAYEMVLARTGERLVTLADGSTKLETNLDRVNAATGKFKSSIARDFSEAGDAVQSFVEGPWFDFSFGLKEAFDKDVTMRTDIMIENIGQLNKAYSDGVVEMRAYFSQMTGGSYQGYKDEIAVVRELRETHAKLEEQRKKEASGFANIREMNESLERSAKARATMAQLNSINTVKGIDDEIRATRVNIAERAQAGKFDEETAKQAEARLNWLAERRIVIEKQAADAAKKAHEQRKLIYTEEMKLADQASERQMALFKAERARVENLKEMNAALGFARQDQAHENQIARAKEILAIEKEITAARMKAGGSKDADVKQQLNAMDKEFSTALHRDKLKQIDVESQRKLDAIAKEKEQNEKTGGTEQERAAAFVKLQAQEDKIRFDWRKARIDETGKYQRDQIARDADKFKQAELEKFKAEEERFNKVKALTQQNFDPKKLMESSDPKKVLKAIQDQRAQKAMEAQSDKDHKLFERGEMGDLSAMRRYDENVRRAGNRARKSAAADFENGTLKTDEVSAAQNKVAQENLTTLQKQGKLSGNQTKAMVEILKTLADQQQSLENADATMQQIIAFAKGQKNAAAKTVQNTAAQVGSLN